VIFRGFLPSHSIEVDKTIGSIRPRLPNHPSYLDKFPHTLFHPLPDKESRLASLRHVPHGKLSDSKTLTPEDIPVTLVFNAFEKRSRSDKVVDPPVRPIPWVTFQTFPDHTTKTIAFEYKEKRALKDSLTTL
jgi:hypothetical protein